VWRKCLKADNLLPGLIEDVDGENFADTDAVNVANIEVAVNSAEDEGKSELLEAMMVAMFLKELLLGKTISKRLLMKRKTKVYLLPLILLANPE